ncbi:MAG: ribosome maturation factor RimP [Alphaproteobacteria bacterium]|nr:ribosome maturation factor RimP [Alphaproteobacteria bacterium]
MRRRRAREARFFVQAPRPSGDFVALFAGDCGAEGTNLTGLNERLWELIEPTAGAEGFDLVRVRLSGAKAKAKTLQIMAERPDKTMTAEDCARLSRAVSAVLDENDPIEGQYVLEVSSPGIDRPLTRLKDFEDWQGYRAKIELDRLVEGRKRFSGVLGGLDGDAVVLDMDGEESAVLIPCEWISDAKLVLTDELIAESFKAAKAALKSLDLADAEASSGQ